MASRARSVIKICVRWVTIVSIVDIAQNTIKDKGINDIALRKISQSSVYKTDALI